MTVVWSPSSLVITVSLPSLFRFPSQTSLFRKQTLAIINRAPMHLVEAPSPLPSSPVKESQSDPPPATPVVQNQKSLDILQEHQGMCVRASDPPPATPVVQNQKSLDILQEHQDDNGVEDDGNAVSETTVNAAIQALEDETIFIPPELLEKADHSSVFYALGTKYNSTVRSYQDKQISLMNKYTQEHTERKLLYNEIMEMKGNIRVFCRCRPLSSEEVSKGHTCSFDFDPSKYRELQMITSDASRKQFKFDHVFPPQANQETVFAETLPIVRSVLDGYNACIFAYGQTGTGKTFTMEGTEETRGVNYRTLEDLFKISSNRSCTMRYEFYVSMLEVYNERIRDLLTDNNSNSKLDIKQTSEGTQEVPGLTSAQAYNTEEVWELLETGKRNRSVGSTSANELSSRSHCLLRVTVKGDNLLNGTQSKSHLWLVDLAGSERVGKTEVEGERLKESQFINKSLSALGDVISSLASKNQHIPYRNSKLTHLLQSSLGGDCKTLMFVQISPSSSDVGETLCSLNFATRVQGVEHGPARRQLDVESFKYKQMAEKLRQEEKEKAKLNENLQLMHLKYASRESVIKNLHEKVRELEIQKHENKEHPMKNLSKKFKDLETCFVETRANYTRLQQPRRQENNPPPSSSSKFHRPPLPPFKEQQRRQPLQRIMNNTTLPPRRKSLANVTETNKIPAMAQRRQSLAPRRRVSLAAIQNHTTLAASDMAAPPPPSLQSLKRRASFIPLPPPSMTTPVRGGRFSMSKFFSPRSQTQQSKIPTFVSPRRCAQRLQLRSIMPKTLEVGGGGGGSGSKLAFTIQRRVVVDGSPAAQLRRPALIGFPSKMRQDTESMKKKRRRMSVV